MKEESKVEIQGQELIVNPSPETSLERKKARLHRIGLALEGDVITDEKRAYLEKAQRRLGLEIQLAQGEY